MSFAGGPAPLSHGFHPDHVQTHRVTTRAVQLAAHGEDGWATPAVLWPRVPRSWAAWERQQAAVDRPRTMTARQPDDPFPPVVVDDAQVDVVLDVSSVRDVTVAALRAHETQVRLDGDWFALSDDVAQPVRSREAFQRAQQGEEEAAAAGDEGGFGETVVVPDVAGVVRGEGDAGGVVVVHGGACGSVTDDAGTGRVRQPPVQAARKAAHKNEGPESSFRLRGLRW